MRKLRCVPRSSATAEALPAAKAMFNGLYMRGVIDERCAVPNNELTFDFTALGYLSASIEKSEETLNEVHLAAVREELDN